MRTAPTWTHSSRCRKRPSASGAAACQRRSPGRRSGSSTRSSSPGARRRTGTSRPSARASARSPSAPHATSPHVSGWQERLDTDAAAFDRAVARVRSDAEGVGATQFETLTAAALADFAARGVDAAVVEAGLGGRLDATNVLGAEVVLLTNIGLEHTDVLGGTRAAIAREQL